MTVKLSVRPVAPLVCPKCQIRPSRKRHLSTAPRLTSNAASGPIKSPRSRYTRLTNRNLIQLRGPDVGEFLQGLVPCKLLDRAPATAGNPIYTAFLTAQGRILEDVFIYPPKEASHNTDTWYIEVDAESTGNLVKHLRKHKLRSKFQLDRLSQDVMSVYSVWPKPNEKESPLEIVGLEREPIPKREGIGGPDPRPEMGSRWLVELGTPRSALQSLVGFEPQETGLQDYTLHRMLNGLAEGQSEIVSLSALPQESNMDFFGGIDFHKGCYLGQELTIRTHHTGVVRKRILPCQIYNSTHPLHPDQETPLYNSHFEAQIPPTGSNISKVQGSGKRSTGKWLGGMGNIGLALCRLEMMTDLSITAEPSNYDPQVEFQVIPAETSGEAVLIRPFVPPWLRASIEEDKRRRMRKKTKEADEEGEEHEE